MGNTKKELLKWFYSHSLEQQEEIHDDCPDNCWNEEKNDYTNAFIEYLSDLREEQTALN